MSKKRSRFDLSYPVQSTFDAGYLVPFYLQDTLPNDTFYISNKSFLRAQPMTAPLLHDVEAYVQYFYCPERILWENTEEFFLGLKVLEGLAGPTRPYIVAPTDGFPVGSLADYLGFPTEQGGIKVSAIPFRAYARIWNEFYRDKSLQSEASVSYEDGVDNITSLSLLSPRWKRDKFQKSEVQKQLGSEVSVPILPSATGGESQFHHYVFSVFFKRKDNGQYSQYHTLQIPLNTNNYCPAFDNAALQKFISDNLNTLTAGDVGLELDTGLDYKLVTGNNQYVDVDVIVRVTTKELTNYTNQPLNQFVTRASISCTWEKPTTVATYVQSVVNAVYNSSKLDASGSLNITMLSQATNMQRYKERMLKADGDYSKFIKSNFGFELRSDIIDEPQYLGGSKLSIIFSEVLQTSEGTDGGVGSMYGHGVGRGKQRPIKFRCPEHGVIIGLISIRPRFVYSQGIDRAWSRESIFDFFLPDFNDIGPQEVFQKELYATSSNGSILFGYSDRFSEYKSRVPKISGQFKTIMADWNMALKFTSPPSLTGEFLSMASGAEGFKRPFAVRDEHSYLMYMLNRVTAIRPVPKISGRTRI